MRISDWSSDVCSSDLLLEKTAQLLRKNNYRTGNIDCTVCLEQPKLNPHIPRMQEKIAAVLGVSSGDVSIKATTSEKMGFVGREAGVAAYVVALISGKIGRASCRERVGQSV